jgi:O-antigen ligase
VCGALHERRFRIAKVGIATMAVAIVVLSGHRASVFAFAAGMIALLLALWIGPSGIVKGARIFVVGLIVFAGIWWGWSKAPTDVRERFADPFESSSYRGRLDAQHLALTAWREAPIFGNGTGSSSYFIASVDQPAFGFVNGVYPHNVTVELLAEVGIVGAVIYLATIVGLLWRALVQLRSPDRQPAVVALFSLVTLAFVEAQGAADLTILNDLWILSALLAIALTRSPSDDVALPSRIARRSDTRILV